MGTNETVPRKRLQHFWGFFSERFPAFIFPFHELWVNQDNTHVLNANTHSLFGYILIQLIIGWFAFKISFLHFRTYITTTRSQTLFGRLWKPMGLGILPLVLSTGKTALPSPNVPCSAPSTYHLILPHPLFPGSPELTQLAEAQCPLSISLHQCVPPVLL